MRTEQLTQGDADIAPIAALIGDPARARVLTALTDGRALPASRLAAEAGVAPSTVSEHRLTPQGETALGELGVDLDAVLARHPAVRYCLTAGLAPGQSPCAGEVLAAATV